MTSPVLALGTAEAAFAAPVQPVAATGFAAEIGARLRWGRHRIRLAASAMANHAGFGFFAVSISGNESGSTGRSEVTNLSINSTARASIAPGGAFTEAFYRPSDHGLVGDSVIGGDVKADAFRHQARNCRLATARRVCPSAARAA
ncbi:hypothetical protein [Falsiroseomonas sp.]|uniref:hypothetical protein n=1 Tax=Falsiroseomonas sp. TaxID=2870721 RepID=UPI003562F3DD